MIFDFRWFDIAHHRFWIEEENGENNLDRFSVRPQSKIKSRSSPRRFVYAAEAEAAAVVMERPWVDSHVRNDPSD